MVLSTVIFLNDSSSFYTELKTRRSLHALASNLANSAFTQILSCCDKLEIIFQLQYLQLIADPWFLTSFTPLLRKCTLIVLQVPVWFEHYHLGAGLWAGADSPEGYW